ncbi:4-carboxy-4-hydroxy-2-oxoadipate aldolase/oxaloacetate decarboxylase [Streptomyces sp. NPDC086080]|uniref:4-carboxy-4-hydroxy-2-oxoadipate aldolase/oxaloacetate decarboxylase n=1 Tax=Streptomyces sp. NPDC086080 TaxID=3365748 RepID=UPI0037CE1AF5
MVDSQSGRALSFGSATLHEAGGRIGALPARLKPAFPGARLAGRALPVLAPVGDNLWIQRAIYEAEPGDVLVVATTAPDEYGYWGEILSEAALARRLGGLVIDGGVRDTAELQTVGFPVFSATVCIRGTLKDPAGPGAVGRPVTLGGITVAPGDLVVGDADGVVVIPEDRAEDVLAASKARVTKETGIIAQLRAGGSSLELYGLQ